VHRQLVTSVLVSTKTVLFCKGFYLVIFPPLPYLKPSTLKPALGTRGLGLDEVVFFEELGLLFLAIVNVSKG